MRAHRVRRGEMPRAGWVLCRELREAEGKVAIAKGATLHPDDLPLLARLPWDELHLVELEADELYEEEAGRRVALAVAGSGVEAESFSGGAWPLVASRRGILEVDVAWLRQVNLVGGVAVHTLFHAQVVGAGDEVARAKIIPLALAAQQVRAVEKIAAAREGVVRVRPFLPTRVGAVVDDRVGEAGLARVRERLGAKIRWFGSELLPPLAAAPTGEAVAGALGQLLRQGAQVIVVPGSHPMDPLDPAFAALERLGVTLERLGVPAHPGSLLWLARLEEVPVIGIPDCGVLSEATVFDLVLPRVLAGERLTTADLADLGHGGLLTRDMAFRFPPYRPARRRGEAP